MSIAWEAFDGPMPHTRHMALMTESRRTLPPHRYEAVGVGVALVVAELLLALLWYPWVVQHLVFSSRLPYSVLRLLIVLPEYVLLAGAVWLVGRSRPRRVMAVALALAAALVAWGVSVALSHLIHTPADIAVHHRVRAVLDWTVLLAVPTLAALAWGVARRRGRWWVPAVAVAPALHWWIGRSDWPGRLWQGAPTFRLSEIIGMSLAMLPVLLAILCCWAVEQLEHARVET
jgi:hypothetical protein